MYAIALLAHALSLWMVGAAIGGALRLDEDGIAYPAMILGSAGLSSALLGASIVATALDATAARVCAHALAAGAVIVGMARAPRWLRSHRVELPWLLLAVAPALLLLLHSVTLPIGGSDAFIFWSSRGRAFAVAGSAARVLSQRRIPEGGYPLLTPAIEWWSYLIGGGHADEQLTKAYQPLLVLSASLAMFRFLARRHGAPWAALSAFLLVSLPFVQRAGVENLADLPLSCVNLWAAMETTRLAHARRSRDAARAALPLGCLAAVKLEGAVLAAANGMVALCLLARARARDREAPAASRSLPIYGLTAAASVLVFCGPWLYLRTSIGLGSAYRMDAPSFSGEGESLMGHAKRIGTYAAVFAYTGGDRYPAPGGFGLLLPVALLLGTRSLFRLIRGGAVEPAWAVLGLQIAAYFGIFLLSPIRLEHQVPRAMDRLLLHLAPVALLASAMDLGHRCATALSSSHAAGVASR